MKALLVAALLIGALPSALASDMFVTDHGAVAGDAGLDTVALQRALDAARDAGGGRVVVPAGVFRSGALFLRQGVELHLEEGAVLLGSNDIADYPRCRTRIEGQFTEWRPALLNAEGLNGLRLTGKGTVDGNGLLFWAQYWQRRKEDPAVTNLAVERPRLVFLDRCADVRIEGLTFRDSGFWHLHLYRCRDVVLEGLEIHSYSRNSPVKAPSTDGIDLDSCQKVTVRRCTISVDDDCIALKGTKGPLALQDESSPPVEDILVEDCSFPEGHGVLTCGSEATVVRNVIVRNCRVGNVGNVVRLKLRPDTPQLYENLRFENLQLDGQGRFFEVKPWLQFFDLKGHPPQPSVVRNVVVRNITGSFGRLGSLTPNDIDTVDGVTLENINLQLGSATLSTSDRIKNLVIRDTILNGKPWQP